MGILGKGEKVIPGGSFRQQRVEKWRSKLKETQQDTQKDASIFGGKPFITRGNLRQQLRKASRVIPGSGGKTFSKEERLKMEGEVFGRRRYGSYIGRGEFSRALKAAKKTKYKTRAERLAAERKIRYLKGLGGM